MQLTPTLLCGDINLFRQQLDQVLDHTQSKAIQVDVIDGLYAENVTLTPSDLALADLDFTDLKLDFHLMTEEPMDYVWELIEHQAQLPIRAVYGQIEKMSYQENFLEEVKKQGWQAGLALNLFTPVESIHDNAWEWLDGVLLMAVEAGEQGQLFQEAVLAKVTELQAVAKSKNKTVEIVIDGGVKAEQLAALKKVGVNQAAVGSALFAAPDFTHAYQELEKAL